MKEATKQERKQVCAQAKIQGVAVKRKEWEPLSQLQRRKAYQFYQMLKDAPLTARVGDETISSISAKRRNEVAEFCALALGISSLYDDPEPITTVQEFITGRVDGYNRFTNAWVKCSFGFYDYFNSPEAWDFVPVVVGDNENENIRWNVLAAETMFLRDLSALMLHVLVSPIDVGVGSHRFDAEDIHLARNVSTWLYKWKRLYHHKIQYRLIDA